MVAGLSDSPPFVCHPEESRSTILMMAFEVLKGRIQSHRVGEVTLHRILTP